MTDAATTATADDVSTAGHTFVTALASKDADALLALFADEVDFRALTPASSGSRKRQPNWSTR